MARGWSQFPTSTKVLLALLGVLAVLFIAGIIIAALR
jgi:hypothetical protein